MNPFSKEQIQDIYTLSPMQEGILYHSLSDTDPNTYLVQLILTMEGHLHVELMKQSFSTLIQRHNVLRTTFLLEKVKQPLQVVLTERPLQFVYKSRADISNLDKKQWIQHYLQKDRQQGFNLTIDPLIRLSVLQTSPSESTCILTFHHILMDGWCSDLILCELFEIYTGLVKGQSQTICMEQPYSQYIEWLAIQDQDSALEYWKAYLSGFEECSILPDQTRSNGKKSVQNYSLGKHSIQLERRLSNFLKELARNNQVTLNAVYQSLWGVVLQKYNNSNDVVFGSVVAGRPSEIPAVERMIGLFINTVPLRIQSAGDLTFTSLIQQIHHLNLNSKPYEHLSLSQIQNQSIGQSLFKHIYVFDNTPLNSSWKHLLAEVDVNIKEVDVIEHTNYDLSITVLPGDETNITFIYNSNIHSEDTVRRMANHIYNVAMKIYSEPSACLKNICILSADEETELIALRSSKSMEHSGTETLADLFERQVEVAPFATALTYGETHISYGELNKQANKLAYVLQDIGVQPDQLIGLLTERSPEMIVGILGILKSNAGYTPLDPENTSERLKVIVQDANLSIIVVSRSNVSLITKLIAQLEDSERHRILVLEDVLEQTNDRDKSNPLRISEANHLAYVMYTSGSTGIPKGIMIEHINVMRVVKGSDYVQITPQDTILQLSNFAFDGSIFDIFGSLLNGARLVLIDKETMLNVSELAQLILKESVSVFFVTTALFNTLVDLEIHCLANVRKVLFGGERVSIVHVNKAFQLMGKGKIIHMYGPTESTVYAMYHEVQEVNEEMFTIPIGRPIKNTEVLVLNSDNQQQPIGATGELCIAGEGLARGYLNNDQLTQEKFFYLHDKRLYKSGDLGRRLANGEIEFTGRNDHQVKIRGFRIEIGEIEKCILENQAIKEVFIMEQADKQGDKRLCAYFAADQEMNTEKIRQWVSERLPNYMIPAYFVKVKKLPLNANGKVDHKKLPIPDTSQLFQNQAIRPRNSTEETIARVWETVLGIENISVVEDFYTLGGDSIKAIQISAQLRVKDITVTTKDIFQYPSVADLSTFIIKGQSKQAQSVNTTVIQNGYDELGISASDLHELQTELNSKIN
ncbi:non-ribosomal peptide synthetase [Paenibacillus polymyxa]|uniref:non-ribosomal peptide synthetase n=1 Tax=Paenibacillus polymyxa TaxID=1406 RepID=UPI003216E31F